MTTHLCLIAQGGATWLGGHYYLQHILYALASLPREKTRDIRITFLCSTPIQLPPLGLDLEVVVAPEVYSPPQGVHDKVLRRLRRIRGLRNPQLHDFLVARNVDFAYPCATGGERAGGYRTAHWIADLQFKHFPEFQTRESLASQTAYLEDIARNADTIVVSSEFGERDCLRHFPESEGKTFALPFRVGFDIPPEGADARVAFNLPSRFFLCSNQFWQNKNHRTVVAALSKLRERGKSVNVVCTGRFHDPRLSTFTDELLGEINAAGVWNEIRLLGAIDRAAQIDLMRRAVAVLQPSLFEGWNTSIEEARLVGRPVIASGIDVHKEQAFEGIRYFSPGDADELADALTYLWNANPGSGEIDYAREAAAQSDYMKLRRSFGERVLALIDFAKR